VSDKEIECCWGLVCWSPARWSLVNPSLVLSLFYCTTVVAFTASLLTGVIGGIAVICGGHANKF
jgi:hypothetical protein